MYVFEKAINAKVLTQGEYEGDQTKLFTLP